MFQATETAGYEPLKKEALIVEKNYTIQKGDLLELIVYSNDGEKSVDPNPELSQSGKESSEQSPIKYLVDQNGVAKFPMVGELKLENLTLREAELILKKEYEKYFKSPFITLRYNNKRVVVLGGLNGGAVIPIQNENVKLTEILGLSQSITNETKAHNIRVLRGEKVFLVDFSTIQGYLDSNLTMQPGDIVYIEPVRRPFTEASQDYRMILSLLASITSLIIVLSR